jgi:SAM-dependent methyltransferase
MITYDQAGDFYFEFVKRGLAQPQSIFHLAADAVLGVLGRLEGTAVCDIACGEGHLARTLAAKGATVTGVDLSLNLIEHARHQSTSAPVTFVHDDAQTLNRLDDDAFDAAVCNLALMDIPDFRAVFRSAWRILRPDARFVFSLLHPCFETPFRVPQSQLVLDEAGNFSGFIVRKYAEEGYWNSGGTGMRGTFGAYHRMLSTYLNGLLEARFTLNRFVEPLLPPGDDRELSHQINSRVPQVLVVAATKVEAGS